MNAKLLIDAIVNQTTVLIAQLATSAGARAPLASVANQVFLDLVDALEAQGIRQKVVADMFGLALRTYQKKVQRLTESATDVGQTLWEAILGFLGDAQLATRAEILTRFRHDDDAMVKAILRDLVESGLAFQTGSGRSLAYRIATDDDIGRLEAADEAESVATLLWAMVYRNGPITAELLAQRLRTSEDLTPFLDRLVAEGRVEADESDPPAYRSQTFAVPQGAAVGWEAAVFDHYQSLVRTICARLQGGSDPAEVGGSTYSFDIWAGHPHEAEARATLARLRADLGALRKRVVAHNTDHEKPACHDRVVVYAGQFIDTLDPTLEEDST